MLIDYERIKNTGPYEHEKLTFHIDTDTLTVQDVTAAIQSCREMALEAFAGATSTPAPASSPAPAGNGDTAAATVLPFGKYRGQTLGELVQADRDYVEWLARESTNPLVRNAAMALTSSPAPAAANGEPEPDLLF